MRNGFAGELRNSIVVNTGTRLGFDISARRRSGLHDADNVAADYDADTFGDLVRLYCTTVDDGAAFAADETNASNNGNTLFATALDNNTINNAAFGALIEEDTTFNPTGNAAGKLDRDAGRRQRPANPRPPVGVGAGGCSGPAEPGTDGGATYRGAFIRSAPVLWTADWTVLNSAGLMAD